MNAAANGALSVSEFTKDLAARSNSSLRVVIDSATKNIVPRSKVPVGKLKMLPLATVARRCNRSNGSLIPWY
jgi:hypothetical protein